MSTSRIKIMEVTHSCGHAESVSISFKRAQERDDRVTYLREQGVCSECYKARQATINAASNAKAAEVAKEAGVPAISIGSEKQIPWAEGIRRAFAKEARGEAGKLILKMGPGFEEKHNFYDAAVEAELFDLTSLRICSDRVKEVCPEGKDEAVFRADRFYDLALEAFQNPNAKFWIDNREGLIRDLRSRISEEWQKRS